MNIQMILSQSEPYQSLQVQRLDGGFVIVSPPDLHWAAEDPLECAQTVAEWLKAEPPRQTAVGAWIANPEEVVCPPSSQFLVTRTKRKRANKIGYLLTFHMTTQVSVTQKIIFNGLDLLTQMMEWMRTKPDTEDGLPHGLRFQPNMDPADDDVFLVKVTTAVMALGPIRAASPGAPPWVISCSEPELQLGVNDIQLCAHFERSLSNEVEGYFAARFGGNVLEIGPRVGEDDVELG